MALSGPNPTLAASGQMLRTAPQAAIRQSVHYFVGLLRRFKLRYGVRRARPSTTLFGGKCMNRWSSAQPTPGRTTTVRRRNRAAPIGARNGAAATTGTAGRVLSVPPTDSHRRRSLRQTRDGGRRSDGASLLLRPRALRGSHVRMRGGV
jgi:hypothetical protein